MKPEELAIAEKAADFMYHWMIELGAEETDCVDAAQEIYQHLTGEQLHPTFFGYE